MNKPNITVQVLGGAHSGKSEVASAIHRALSKNKLYGVQLVDDNILSKETEGHIKVQVMTVEHDPVMHPMQITSSSEQGHWVTMSKLKAAFLQWELTIRRAGSMLTEDETRSLPAGQVAENAAKTLMEYLNSNNGKQPC